MHATLTGIAGILAGKEEEASSKLSLMLAAMELRGTIIRTSIVKGKNSVAAIGICSHPNQELASPNPEETSIVVDGTFRETLDMDIIGGQLDEHSIADTIDSSGPFACLAVLGGKLLAGRDVVGQKPLYFGRDPLGAFAFASLKSALAEIQVAKVKSVPPGQLISASMKRTSVLANKSLAKMREIRVSEEEAATKLRALLIASLEADIPEDLALAFSGGLDSTLVAQAAKENALRPELITVGMKGQPEIKHAKAMAKRLSLDIMVRELSQSDILTSLSDVVHIVESVDPVLVGVSVPLFFVCELAKEMGMECLLAGQLSDELFAGYGRFDDLALKRELRAARNEIWTSVLAASSNDFEPGDKLAVSHRLELRCPFAYLLLVQYALKLPTQLKLKIIEGRVIRKYILRKVARDWKLPDEVVNRPKKAVQYSTGVQKILLKEARRRGMTLSSFLGSLLRES